MIFGIFEALRMHVTRLQTFYGVAFALIVLTAGAAAYAVAPPEQTQATRVTIASGTTLSGSAIELQNAGLLRYRRVFRLCALIEGVQGAQTGTYYITDTPGACALALRIGTGDTREPTIRITFPEGTPVRQMGDLLKERFPTFNAEHFIDIALPYEGFLFPDTYAFTESVTPEEVLSRMRGNFAAHASWKQGHVLTEQEVLDAVILASLLESEGKTREDKRIIAGILQNRMRIGMPLQVDAAFGYIYGRTGYVPTAADLKSTSAYNTYRTKGLPPTPITNPGEDSLTAALTPENTPYLYYLTGADGSMHYAETFEEHVANKRRYLSL